MRSRWLLCALALGFLACNQQTLTTAARISGANDLLQSGDLMFVTSSDRDELRVLHTLLGNNQTVRDFVRAPNPLEALSVPVVDFSVELARDVRYGTLTLSDGSTRDGAEVTGPYVYARSGGTGAISVVNADPTQLKEVKRLFTSDPITAFAARAVESGPSQLFYATYDGVRGILWEVAVPAPEAIEGASLSPRQVTAFPGSAVRSILVMPADNELAIAVKPTTADPRTAFVLNTGTLATRTLTFPVPVRRLVTHPRTQYGAPDNPSTLAEGTRIYAILDEETCTTPPAPNCPGFFVVDSQSGLEVLDATGHTMIMDTGGGLPQGLHVSAGSNLSTQAPRDTPGLALLGIFTTSGGAFNPVTQDGANPPAGGQIYFFDAFGLRHFDTNKGSPAAQVLLQDSVGSPRSLPENAGPQNISLGDGAVIDENVFVTYQGLVPGLVDLPRDLAQGPNLTLPLAGRAFTGDVIQLGPSGSPCGPDLTVTVSGVSAVINDLSGVSPECAGQTVFSVRAFEDPDPDTHASRNGNPGYVVVGTTSGYMGRVAAGGSLSFQNKYYFHPGVFGEEGNYDPARPQIAFSLAPQAPSISRDFRYLIATTGAYKPYFVYPDPSLFVDAYLPGAVVNVPSLARAWVAYPSTPGVYEVDLLNATPSGANGGITFLEHR